MLYCAYEIVDEIANKIFPWIYIDLLLFTFIFIIKTSFSLKPYTSTCLIHRSLATNIYHSNSEIINCAMSISKSINISNDKCDKLILMTKILDSK